MKRIGLSQRVSVVEEYGERRDCLDQRWAELLWSLDLVPVPLSNQITNVSEYIEQLDLDGVVLTGGSDISAVATGDPVAPKRNRFERSFLEYAVNRRIPVLGVCRGLQIVNAFFGGSLTVVEGHVDERHPIEPTDIGSSTFTDRKVNSYHTYGIAEDGLATNLVAEAISPDGLIEAVSHEVAPIVGIMWHLERDSISQQDQYLIKHAFECQ